tara:strand:- start:8719 stop:9639 length:921 start_codon:yes stop_codon:yes gene_type:complete
MKQTILTFYQFTDFPDFRDWKPILIDLGIEHNIVGSLVLAKEGINATISGEELSVHAFLEKIKQDSRFQKIKPRISQSDRTTFYRLKIFLREEIVTLGDDSINPSKIVGEYVEPEDWNSLLEDPEITLVDTRNDYEVAVGTFEGAIDPNTKTFREWPEFVENSLKNKGKGKIAMFCTGGIRCEKASSHLLKNGFKKVYHLKGGILNYLEKIKPNESKWRGECFIFDHRVSVVHGLEDGETKLCFGCRWPLREEDLSSPNYEAGVSCPRCDDSLSLEKKESLRERQRQMEIAKQRRQVHIGQKIDDH